VADVELSVVLKDLDDAVKTELASTPEVVDMGDHLDVEGLPITARRWHKVKDVVAVVADLKNSTKLGTGIWAASTASIYQGSRPSTLRNPDIINVVPALNTAIGWTRIDGN